MTPPPDRDRDLAAFFASRWDRSVRFVVGYTSWHLDAEAIAMDAWRKIVQNPDGWSRAQNPDAYLYRCVINTANTAIAQARRGPHAIPAGGSDDLDQMAHRGPYPPPSVGAAEGARASDPRVAAALAALSDKERAVVLLDSQCNAGELPDAAIGEILGVQRNTVRKNRARALGKLRAALDEDCMRSPLDPRPLDATQQPRNVHGREEGQA